MANNLGAWAFSVCVVALPCTPALAAEVTDTADAFDIRINGAQATPDPWDLRLSTA